MRECEISWTNSYVSATGHSRDQKSNQSRLGFVLQTQTTADINIVLLAAQTPLIQHGGHADAVLRLWHLDTIKGTRKNDTIDSTQNASPDRPDRKYKRKVRPERTRKTEEVKNQTTEAQMKKLQRVAVQTRTATMTATILS